MLHPGKLAAYCRAQYRDVALRELLGGASLALALKMLGVVAAFFFSLFLARSFSTAEVGLYFLAISILEIMATAGRLGLEQGAVAIIGRGMALQRWSDIRGAFSRSLLLVLLASTAGGALLFLLSPVLALSCFGSPRLIPLLRIISLAVLPVALFNYLGEALKGLPRLRDSQFVTTTCQPALLLLGLLALHRSATIEDIAWLQVSTAGVTAGLAYLLWRAATARLRGVAGAYPTRLLLDTAIPLLWVNLLQIVHTRTVTVVLGFFGTAEEVGVLAIALRVSLLANIALLAMNAISAPKFAALHGRKNLPALASMARKSTALLALGTIPLFGAMFCFPDLIMGMFGRDFAAHGAVLAVLAAGQCVNVATGPVGALLAMTGRQRLLHRILLLATPVHIALQFALTPHFRAMGAAWAIAINTALINLALVYAVRQEFGFYIFLPGRPAGPQAVPPEVPPAGDRP